MVCDKCSKVYDVEFNALDCIEDIVRSQYGHSLSEITLTLKGICCECSSDAAV